MKKRILLFAATGSIAIISLTSGLNGAGAEKGYDCTGAETVLGNVSGCAVGVSCHGTAATSGITVTLELDSAGIAKTYYIPGNTYTVKITGTNTTSNLLPYFGFQVSCIKGTTSVASGTPVNAGTFATTGLPARVRYTAAIPGYFDCNVIEHNDTIRATTGTGGSGSTYVESFRWTAPAAGTGAISFWGVLNAVNGNNLADAADKWNTTHLLINEGTTAVENVVSNVHVKAYPNPVINDLNLAFGDAEPGTYTVRVLSLTGSTIFTSNVEINGVSQVTLNTTNWHPGLYNVIVEKGIARQVLTIVK